MNYQEKENGIVEYVKNNFNKYATDAEETINHFLNEFLDFDRYVYNNALFFNFENYNYEELTNTTRLENSNMRIFIVVRGDTESKLHEKLRTFASTFYTMFESSKYNFEGIVDYGMITAVNFFDAVEGDKNKKLCEITLSLVKETI
jgi:hypothetical protein